MSYLIVLVLLVICFLLASLSLYLIYRYEDMEGLVRARTKSLLIAEQQVENRDKILKYQDEKHKKLKNKLTILEAYIMSNNYGNAEVRLQKLKELARPGNQN